MVRVSQSNLGFMQNHFQLFDLPQQYALDQTKLESNFRSIQSASHPDRYVTATEAEKLVAMQTATNANEAYQTIKHPTLRAIYLLATQGIHLESDRAMPADFLMQQMEWREEVESNAHNLSGLHRLQRAIKQEVVNLTQTLGNQLDIQHDPESAASTVRKLQFMDKLREEIERKIDLLED